MRQQNDELVAGVAADDARRRRQLAQRTRDDAQHGVALQVAVIVVDVLEVVDVDDDQRDRRERTALGEHLVRDVDERTPRQTPVRSSFGPVTREIATAERSAAFDSSAARWRDRRRARLHQLLEQREQRGIELRADVGAHDLHRLVVRERALVAALASSAHRRRRRCRGCARVRGISSPASRSG